MPARRFSAPVPTRQRRGRPRQSGQRPRRVRAAAVGAGPRACSALQRPCPDASAARTPSAKRAAPELGAQASRLPRGRQPAASEVAGISWLYEYERRPLEIEKGTFIFSSAGKVYFVWKEGMAADEETLRSWSKWSQIYDPCLLEVSKTKKNPM